MTEHTNIILSKNEIEMVVVDDIKTNPTLAEMWASNEKVEHRISQNMGKQFDLSHDFVTVNEGNVLIEGYSRYNSAIKAGIKEIPVRRIKLDVDDKMTATSHTDVFRFKMEQQANRRNIDDRDIYKIVKDFDEICESLETADDETLSHYRMNGLEFMKTKSAVTNKAKAYYLEQYFSIPSRKVKETLLVIGYTLRTNDTTFENRVISGEMTIHSAYRGFIDKKKANTGASSDKATNDIENEFSTERGQSVDYTLSQPLKFKDLKTQLNPELDVHSIDPNTFLGTLPVKIDPSKKTKCYILVVQEDENADS